MQTSDKQALKFTKTALEALQPTSTRQTVYDEATPGLAVRISPSGHKAFYFYFRPGKGRSAPSKKIQLGTFPEMSVEQARLKARQYLGQVIQGQDPANDLREAKNITTIASVLETFLLEHVQQKLKPKSIRLYAGAINTHIIPALGKIRVEAVTHRDIARLHHDLRDRPYMANRTVAVLSKFFGWCETNGYRDRGSNPVVGLEKFKEEKKQDFLDSDQLAVLGVTISALEKSGKISPLAAAAVRILMLTGMRLMEVLALKWEYLDLEAGTAKLPDSKTGFKVVHLSAPALDILKGLTRYSNFVFPSDTSKTGHLEGLRRPWGMLRARAGLKGRWRIHDLRHAFASMMVNSGASLPIVGKILGHSQPATTARYAHLEKSPAQKAADEAAAKITESWNKTPVNNSIIPFRPRQVEG